MGLVVGLIGATQQSETLYICTRRTWSCDGDDVWAPSTSEAHEKKRTLVVGEGVQRMER